MTYYPVMRAWMGWLVGGAVLGGLGWLVWGRIQAEGAEAAKLEQEQSARRGGPSSVEIAVARASDLVETIDSVGTASAPFSVNLSPRTTGRITFLEVREGDAVKEGQVVARIDGSEAGARVLENQANLSEARSRLAQAQATTQSNDVQIQQGIRQAQAELNTAQAALEQVKADVQGSVAEANGAVQTSKSALVSAQARKKNTEAQAKASKVALDNAKARQRRLESLFQQGFRSGQEAEDAQAATASAQAGYEVALGAVESAEADVNSARSRLAADEATLKAERDAGAAQVRAAEARIDQAESGLAQSRANQSQSPAYRANLRALEAGVRAAEAQLKAAGVSQSETSLRSPISGTITSRAADLGSIAGPGQPVVRIEFLDWLFVDAQLPVAESGRVKKGFPVSIKFDGLEDPVIGQVDQVAPSADAESRQFLVKVRVPNPDRSIRPGMFARVSIEVDRTAAQVTIPQDALSERGSVTVVTAEGKAEMRPVKTGKRGGSLVEVLSGLKAGEKVVVLAYNPVRDGAEVQVTAERLPDGGRKVIEPPAAKKESEKRSA